MSERRYEVELPKDMLCSTPTTAKLSEQEIDTLMERLQAAKAQAETDKLKAWDFGIDHIDHLVIHGQGPWYAFSTDYPAVGPIKHIYGNLKEIVEQQGPIVVGMTVSQASICGAFLRDNYCANVNPVGEQILAALARYERNKP